MTGRGFDISDEGGYLLSYRWWQTDTRTFTGAQYIYGPIFQALRYNIADLRLVRVATIVAAHATFGWQFMRWLRTRRPEAPATRLWELGGTATITATGGIVYGWLPLSPGYNDVVLLGSLVVAAMVLNVASSIAQDERPPWPVPIFLGPVVASMLLAKWASLGVVTLSGLVVFALLAPVGIRYIRRFAGLFIAGLAVTLLLLQLFVMPLGKIVTPLRDVNRLAARDTNAPLQLMAGYISTSVPLLVLSCEIALPAAVVALACRSRLPGKALALTAVASMAFAWFAVGTLRGWTGGRTNLRSYAPSIIAMAIIVATAAMCARQNAEGGQRGIVARRSPNSILVITLLLLLPLAQALGTGNALFEVSLNCFAPWVALMIAATSRLDRAMPVRVLQLMATTSAVALACVIGITGVLQHPYRTAGFASSTSQATALSPLSSLKLPAAELARLAYLRRRLSPYLPQNGQQPILAYDEMPGVVLALGGQPVGEVWLSRSDRTRSAAGVRSACSAGNPWGDHQPILLFDRKITKIEVGALRSCDLSFATDYRELAMNPSFGIRAYVPRARG